MLLFKSLFQSYFLSVTFLQPRLKYYYQGHPKYKINKGCDYTDFKCNVNLGPTNLAFILNN